VAEEENFSRGSRFFELCGFVRKDFTGCAVFSRNFECMRVLEPWRMKRKGDDLLTEGGRVRGKRQKSYCMVAGERIAGGEENGDVVFGVHGDDGSLNQLRRAIGAAHKDVGLAAVVKGFQDVGDRQQIPLFVNEEPVAKEAVVVATRGWRSVELINDGADGGGERRILREVLGCGPDHQAGAETGEQT
jgi:hypothetical protein